MGMNSVFQMEFPWGILNLPQLGDVEGDKVRNSNGPLMGNSEEDLVGDFCLGPD